MSFKNFRVYGSKRSDHLLFYTVGIRKWNAKRCDTPPLELPDQQLQVHPPGTNNIILYDICLIPIIIMILLKHKFTLTSSYFTCE